MFWPKLSAAVLLASSAIVTSSPAQDPVARRHFNSCNKNPALSVLKLLRATGFCTEFLGLKTVTVKQTCTTSTTVPSTTVVTTTTTVPYTETLSTTLSEAVVVVETLPGPTMVITEKPTITNTAYETQYFTETTTETSTVTTYAKNMRRDRISGEMGAEKRADSQNAVVERERQLKALDVLEERGMTPRKIVVPAKLKLFASAAISTACKCYVTAPTKIVKTTTTITKTAVKTNTDVVTTSKPVATSYISITKTYTTTETTVLPGVTLTETLVQTESTTSTIKITAANTAKATVTATAPGLFIRQFSGNNCVQNKYNHYELVQEAYSTPERLFQVCAAKCASFGAGCRSFFAYQDNDYPYQWCIIDDAPYDPSYRQCGIPFSGVNLAYNSPY